eukprot:6356208-Lingulodinium_polyedra.AAC.1
MRVDVVLDRGRHHGREDSNLHAVGEFLAPLRAEQLDLLLPLVDLGLDLAQILHLRWPSGLAQEADAPGHGLGVVLAVQLLPSPYALHVIDGPDDPESLALAILAQHV